MQLPLNAQQPKVGRPKLGTAALRHAHLLDCAMHLFMTQGLAQTSIAKIAKTSGVSTRTIYEKYPNKGALMIAAIKQMVERDITDLQNIEGLHALPPHEALYSLGEKMLLRVLDPNMISFFRFVVNEAKNHQEISNEMIKIGPMRIQKVFEDYLEYLQQTTHTLAPNQSAPVFCEMLIGEPRFKALFGNLDQDLDMTAHIKFVVEVFLNGIQKKQTL